ncbi:MAG: DUF6174 domain-containing protein [Steroidobacteraceae bacterium]
MLAVIRIGPLLAALIFSASACGATTEQLLAQLNSARSLWAQRGPVSYSFVISDGCFCLSPAYNGPLLVTVRPGRPIRLVYIGRSTRKYAKGDRVTIETHLRTDIPQLFDWIEKAIRASPAAFFTLEYDSVDGHPVKVELDDPTWEDEQTIIAIESFRRHDG